MAILADKIEIKIDGKTFDNYVFSNISLIQDIQKPSELRFFMHKNTLSENENDIRFSLSEELLGKKVEFSLKTKRGDKNEEFHQDTLEFKGIIFNVNALRKNIKAGLVIEVIAYSPDYLLFDNPHCYSYENETLKNIVAETLNPYDISIQNNPRMEEEIPYTVQYNETNYAFLSRLALRFGEWLYYDGKELVFGEIKKTDTLELMPFYDILNYQYRLDMEHLNFTHAHHNYLDYENTKNDGQSSTEDKMHNMTDIAYNQSKSLYSKETFQHLQCSAPEGSFDETEYTVKVQGFGKKAQQMVCLGSTNRADLKIGSVIKIKESFEENNQKTGSCNHDELLICKITHITDSNGSYENEFTAIPSACEYPPYTYGDCYPKAESQRAVVKDNQDPEKLGRIRVQFLWQKEQDDSLLTPWIRIAQPHGGDNKGFYFIPEIDEEVMVSFENGNAEKPYVTGTLYHGKQRPGDTWYTDENEVKALRTKNGHTIEIHDKEQGGFIQIYDHEKGNYILTLSTDEQLIRLQSSGNIELLAENDIILDAKNNIKINAGMNIDINAGENINEMAGTNVLLGAGEDMTINAGNNRYSNVSNNDSLFVSNNQTSEIGGNKDEQITEKYQLVVENMLVDASEKLKLQSKTHEQKADDVMKLDGGKTLNLFAKNVKMN